MLLIYSLIRNHNFSINHLSENIDNIKKEERINFKKI